jgi:hypothetical protein
MAEIISQLPTAGGRIPKKGYPWDEWLDGTARTLTQGVDFDVKPSALRTYAYEAATHRGVRVKTVLGTDGRTLHLQLRKKTP